MKISTWQILLGTALILLSVTLYLFQIEVFHDPRDTFFYLFQDVAFVPIEVLLVTLIVNGLLSMRERRARLEKLNMVIGAFFTEVGARLLTLFCASDPGIGEIRGNLVVRGDWSEREFARVSGLLKGYACGIAIERINLPELREFFLGRRDFLLRLLENPSLLEHETFTELLLAVFHLVEELSCRKGLTDLPETDLRHLAGDMRRVYVLLMAEWLAYMKHLKDNYPYLFSLAMRLNPFDEEASPVVTS